MTAPVLKEPSRIHALLSTCIAARLPVAFRVQEFLSALPVVSRRAVLGNTSTAVAGHWLVPAPLVHQENTAAQQASTVSGQPSFAEIAYD